MPPALPIETNIYHVLERILQSKTEPVTCVELYDLPEIRTLAHGVNHVSDALGNLYRRGYLYREPAPKTPRSQAKWAYAWKHVKKREQHAVEQVAMMQRAFDAQPRDAAVVHTLLDKPHMRISESGGRLVIELAKMRITIEPGG